MEPISIPVKSVSPAFANQSDLSSRSTAERSIRIRNANPELLQALDSRRNKVLRVRTTSNRIVRDVDSVHHDGVLVAASARDCATLVAKAAIPSCVIRRSSRLQGQQLSGIPL